jgi:hypothetical protein
MHFLGSHQIISDHRRIGCLVLIVRAGIASYGNAPGISPGMELDIGQAQMQGGIVAVAFERDACWLPALENEFVVDQCQGFDPHRDTSLMAPMITAATTRIQITVMTQDGIGIPATWTMT